MQPRGDRFGDRVRGSRVGMTVARDAPPSIELHANNRQSTVIEDSMAQPILFGQDAGELFERAPDNWRVEGWLAQLSWARTLGHEGGLFVTIGRRANPAEVRTDERQLSGIE